jgi:hypothetical protein
MIKPGYIMPRSDWTETKKDITKPLVDIELEWVHGYQSKTSKNNIAFLADGSIAYHAAAVGIVYSREEGEQPT